MTPLSMKSRRRLTGRGSLALGLVALLGLNACAKVSTLRGRIAGLQGVVEQAERNGAKRCAPRELALAQANLQFAELELAQGHSSRAEEHLWLAEPNVNAALKLSPPEYCTEHEVAAPPPPPPPPKPGDRDGDGYLDPNDGCPDQAENFNGYQDADGCPDDPDTDGDGLADSVDACILDPEDTDGYLDSDGCPDLDNDADGILDKADKCPLEPEDPDGFQDEDGCPDPDDDGDTVLDVEDQCPTTPGDPQGPEKGCPTKQALVVVTDCEVKITQQIHFDYNKATIRKESFPILDAVVEVMQKAPSMKIEVQGHTDNRGTAKYNKTLSDKRAASVKKYLIAHGIEASRLDSHGYGFERPLVPNDTDANRALNRRVQFLRTEGGAKPGCPQ